jgi:hypothetical protein
MDILMEYVEVITRNSFWIYMALVIVTSILEHILPLSLYRMLVGMVVVKF